MDEPKHSYFINIQSHETFSEPNGVEWDFKIDATESQVAVLERLFDKTEEIDWESYFLLQIYSLLYYLGDEKSRAHIREMG